MPFALYSVYYRVFFRLFLAVKSVVRSWNILPSFWAGTVDFIAKLAKNPVKI